MITKITLLVLLAVGAVQIRASCFGTDASWNPGSKPIVSQPSKNDPAKVMVDWTRLIKNSKCVDKYFLWVWPDGTPKTSPTAKKVQIDKSITSKIVEVDPCVGYRFSVELEETEMRSTNKLTSETVFKTAAIAKVINLDKTKFTVGYHWDPVKQVSDLRMASISFPKSLIQYPSCLDYIQVTGSEVRAKPSLSRHSSTASMEGQVAWGHLGKTYNPSISVGGASTLPAGITFAGGSNSPSMSRGSSPVRGPLAGTYSGSSSSLQSQRSTSSTGSSPFGPIEKPLYSNSLPRAKSTGALKKAGPVKVQPPFLKPMIEILIASKDCAEFNFEVKVFNPSSREIGKVQNIHLPALADIPTYIPPPITNVMSITFGKSGKPVYGVKTASGVSAACLPSYFEALDAYRQRLENEVGYHAAKTGVSQAKVSQTSLQSEVSQEQTLKTHGCICTSPHLEFSTTDANLLKSHAADFGHYHFKGMHAGHPYYEKMAHNHAGSHSHSGHGHAQTSNNKPTGGSTTNTSPRFLFFDAKDKQWVFADKLGSTRGIDFGSAQKSLAKCPADPPASGTWQRKSSILGRWKKEATLKVACETNL